MEIKLQQALTARKEQYGQDIPQRFINQCLKVIDPRLQHIAFYVGDHTGEKYNKPTLADGSPNPIWPVGIDAPRDPSDRKYFYADLRLKQYRSWIDRINAGEFDSEVTVGAEPAEAERLDPEPDPSPPVEVVKSEPSDVDKAMDNVCKQLPDVENKTLDKVDELVKDNATKGTPPPQRMATALKDVAGSPGTSLLRALDDYIASTDSPPEDKPDIQQAILKLGNIVAEQQKTMEKQSEVIKKMSQAIQTIGQKVPEMIKAEILKKFS